MPSVGDGGSSLLFTRSWHGDLDNGTIQIVDITCMKHCCCTSIDKRGTAGALDARRSSCPHHHLWRTRGYHVNAHLLPSGVVISTETSLNSRSDCVYVEPMLPLTVGDPVVLVLLLDAVAFQCGMCSDVVSCMCGERGAHARDGERVVLLYVCQ